MKQKVVFITGAGSGIGRECTKLLAENNYKVFMVGRNEIKLKDLADKLKIKTSIEYFCADVGNYDEIKKAVSNCFKKFETIDILINSAGIGIFGLASEFDVNDWNKLISTNLNGIFNTTRLILPVMLARKQGHIINIGSDQSKYTFPGCSGYSASKFGVRAFTDTLSKEVINKNIKVSFVGPGAVDTTFFNDVTQAPDKKERKQKFLKAVEVAEIILFIITRSKSLVIDEIYFYNLARSYKVPLAD